MTRLLTMAGMEDPADCHALDDDDDDGRRGKERHRPDDRLDVGWPRRD
jgi:hypothetical protein